MRKSKGSQKHTMIQREIQDMLREIGYIVIIEPPFDGRNADLLVQNPQTLETTIIEIELHKNYRHAIKSIHSDLRFCNKVIVLCGNQTILRSLNNYSGKFLTKDRKRSDLGRIPQTGCGKDYRFDKRLRIQTAYAAHTKDIRTNSRSRLPVSI